MKKILFICTLIAAASADAAKYTVSYKRYPYSVREFLTNVGLYNIRNQRIILLDFREFDIGMNKQEPKTVTVDEPIAFIEAEVDKISHLSGVLSGVKKYRIDIPEDQQSHDFNVFIDSDKFRMHATAQDLTGPGKLLNFGSTPSFIPNKEESTQPPKSTKHHPR